MKNTKILLGLVICIITLISCGKEQTTSTICSTCISKPDIIKNIDVFGRNYEADIYIGKNSEKSDIKYRIAIIEPQNTITKDDYINLNLKGILNGKIDINEIVGCVIFTNGDITNFKEIKQEQIIGYLIYINKNNSLYVNSYKKVTEKYELVDDLSMEIGYTSANDIYYYKSFLSKQNNKDDISATVFFSYDKLPSNPRFKIHLHELIAARYLTSLQNKFVNRPPGDETGHCDATPCSPSYWGDICIPQERQNGPASWTCFKDIVPTCLEAQVAETITQTGESYVIDRGVLYDFRDSIMQKSINGANFIEIYYYVSSVIHQVSIPLDLAYETYHNLNNIIIPKCSTLISSPYNSNTAFLSSEVTILNTNIENFRLLSSDSAFNNYLDEIESDLNVCVGKDYKFVTQNFLE